MRLKCYFRNAYKVRKRVKGVTLLDPNRIIAMQEELNKFQRSEVWELVLRPLHQGVIGTKWVYRNKMDENGLIIRNKARLVGKGYSK